VALVATIVVKGGDEEAFAGEHARQALHNAATGAGLHLNAALHVGHCAHLGAHTLAGVQLDLDKLKVVAKDFVVDYVCHDLTPLLFVY
jgi:hypothetical protein